MKNDRSNVSAISQSFKWNRVVVGTISLIVLGAFNNFSWGNNGPGGADMSSVNPQFPIGHQERLSRIAERSIYRSNNHDNAVTGRSNFNLVSLLLDPRNAQPTPNPDFGITKFDGVTSVVSGTTTTYVITVTYSGAAIETTAKLKDPVASGLTKTAVRCSPTTPGVCITPPTIFQLENGYTLPPLNKNDSYVIEVDAHVDASSGDVINLASVGLPPDDDSNGVYDLDHVTREAHLAVTKDDGVTSVNTGASTTYTVSVTNNGPSLADGTTISDPAVAGLTKTAIGVCSASGGAVCPSAGSLTIANIEGGTVTIPTLPSGGSISFTITATVTATSGSVTNTFTATPPQGTAPSTPVSVSDTDTVPAVVDLVVTKDDGVTSVNAGTSTTYNLTLLNNGPSAADGATIQDAAVTGLTKTSIGLCTATGGAACPTAGNGAGQLNIANLEAGTVVVPILPAGGKISFSITVAVDGSCSAASVTNVFKAVTPSGTTESSPSNNMAFDTDIVNCVVDLGVTKDDGKLQVSLGMTTTYTVRVTNNGPISVTGAILKDPVAVGLSKTSVSCSPAVNNKCVSSPTISQLEGGGVSLPTLASGQFYEVLISALVTSHGPKVTNTANIAPPLGVTDNNSANNSASDVDDVIGTPATVRVCKFLPANDPTPLNTPFTFTLKISGTPVDSAAIFAGDCWVTVWTIDTPVVFTIVESPTQNVAVQSINVVPSSKLVGTPNLQSGTVIIVVSGGDDITVNYTNQSTVGRGVIEICKQLEPGDPIPVGTMFTFAVTGAIDPTQSTVQVPAGAFGSPNCSSAIVVATGNQTITETFRADTIVSSITVTPSDPTTDVIKLPSRSVTINVPSGGVTNQRIVTFTNQTTRSGYVEVCKDAQGIDVTGTFKFNVQGAPDNPYSVPVGFCSRPIQVTIPQVGNSPFTAAVTELGQSTAQLVDVTTNPTNALINPIHFDEGFDANGNAFPACPAVGCNQYGGYVNVNLTVGGVPSQKIVRFVNQAQPGQVKICKALADNILDPLTLFRFNVYGVQGPLPGTPTGGTPVPVDVFPGSCKIVPGTWVVGTPVDVVEMGISPANTAPLPAGITAAMVRTSSVTASTPFLTPPITIPGCCTLPGTAKNPAIDGSAFNSVSYGIVAARSGFVDITFTNFIYRPAVLKLCKTSTNLSIATGTNFTFTIAPENPLTTWPYPVTQVTIPVGSCKFIDGPFPQNANFGEVNPFNYGTKIVITENAAPGYSVNAITSGTLMGSTPPGTLTFDLPTRQGTLTLNQPLLPNFMFNELTFDNRTGSGSSLRRAISDFDGDGKSDIAVFRPSDGNWYWLSSQNSTFNAFHFGTSGDKIVPGDYDGDGKTDFAVWRPSDGTWYLQRSTAGFSATQFGLGTDLPAQGDFDGDGKTDIAVFRPSSGIWYMLKSTTGFAATQFGTSGDKPVTGDYDGDGKTDIAVFRPSDGNWYMLRSSAGFTAVQFGIPTDKVAPGDYDGDGKTDLAVYRDGNPGIWYLMKSTLGFAGMAFGVTGDLPVTGDFDGDGKADISVYRPSTGTWYLLRSTSGFTGSQFGAATDKPVPAGYVPIQ